MCDYVKLFNTLKISRFISMSLNGENSRKKSIDSLNDTPILIPEKFDFFDFLNFNWFVQSKTKQSYVFLNQKAVIHCVNEFKVCSTVFKKSFRKKILVWLNNNFKKKRLYRVFRYLGTPLHRQTQNLHDQTNYMGWNLN